MINCPQMEYDKGHVMSVIGLSIFLVKVIDLASSSQ